MTPKKGMRFTYANATRRVDGVDIPAVYVVTSVQKRWGQTYVYVKPDYPLDWRVDPFPVLLIQFPTIVGEVL